MFSKFHKLLFVSFILNSCSSSTFSKLDNYSIEKDTNIINYNTTIKLVNPQLLKGKRIVYHNVFLESIEENGFRIGTTGFRPAKNLVINKANQIEIKKNYLNQISNALSYLPNDVFSTNYISNKTTGLTHWNINNYHLDLSTNDIINFSKSEEFENDIILLPVVSIFSHLFFVGGEGSDYHKKIREVKIDLYLIHSNEIIKHKKYFISHKEDVDKLDYNIETNQLFINNIFKDFLTNE